MSSLHPPRPDEVPHVTGRHHIVGRECDLVEEWEIYRQPDGSLVWRGDQHGVLFGRHVRRLGHAVIYSGRVERLQLHQRTPAGVHRQTYTVYEDGVLLSDNRVPGRRIIPAPAGTVLVGLFVSLVPDPPRVGGRQPVLWVDTDATGLLTSTVGEVRWTPAGSDHLTGPAGEWVCARWNLTDPWGNSHSLWVADSVGLVRWEQAAWVADLAAWRQG